jgi:uncharacterized protein
VAGVVWGGLVEPRLLRIRRHEVASALWPKGWPRLKIAVMSDLHASWPHVTAGRVERLVERVLALAPNIIFLPGDFISTHTYGARPVTPERVALALAPLAQAAPTLAVLGNHDHHIGRRRMREVLSAQGIAVLVNEVVEVDIGGTAITIAGMDCMRTGLADPRKTFGSVGQDVPAILLSHVPDIFPKTPENIVLTVSGHTHGGQVRIPGLPPFVTMSRLPRHMAHGLHRLGERYLYVSAGVGSTGLPVRFGMPPEIALLELVRA